MTKTTRLAVYGSLRAGMRNHHLLRTATYEGRTTIPGALIDLGPYPAAIHAEGAITAELYTVEDLTAIDHLEQYDPAHPETSWLIRETLPDGTQAYYLREIPDPATPVPGNDWLAYATAHHRREAFA